MRRASRMYTLRIVAVVAAAVLLIAGYGWGTAKYRGSFYPATSAYGVGFGSVDVQQVHPLAQEALSAYSLHVSGEGLDLTIPGSDISLAFASDDIGRDVLDAQGTLLWPVSALLPHDASRFFEVVYDREALLGILREAVASGNEAAQQAADPDITFDKARGQWVYEPAEAGAVIDADALAAACEGAISSYQPELAVPAECVAQSELSADAEKKRQAAQRANELCAAYDVSFTLGDSASFRVGAAQAAQWITFGEDYEASIDQGKVDEWLDTLRGLLSGASTRTYVRPDGKVCTVEGGDYLWRAQDVDGAVEAVRAALEGDASDTSIPCSVVGNGFLGIPGADWGPRYVDVDMTEQHARFYDDGGDLVWESDIITGVWGTQYETPTGVYTVTEKLSPAQLRSVGTLEYIDENGNLQVEEDHLFGRDVDYWMPFIGTFIGLHDAWWQTEFGGELYKDGYFGSGGCVNLPTEKAAELYGMLEPGDVVVTHY